jgi:hypothetical protein
MERIISLVDKRSCINIFSCLILFLVMLLCPCFCAPGNLQPDKYSSGLWLPPGPPTVPVPGPSEVEGIDNGAFYLRQYLKWDDPDNDYNPPDVSTNTVTSKGKDSKNELGGVNFSSINLNYISTNINQTGRVNFDYILKCQKADDSTPILVDNANHTLMSITAFLTGLILPNNKFWVNLNPWEPDRITGSQLEVTDVGRIMLEADLQMKKDFSNYGNPCANESGKLLYDLLAKKHDSLVIACMEKFPDEIENSRNVQFGASTRFWIVPDTIYAYVNGTQIFIINASLAIYSEPVSEHSYFMLNNQDSSSISKSCQEELNRSAKEYGKYTKELVDELILPYVVKDVNYGERYRDLRNVYTSLALAQWYKSSISPSIDIFQVISDSSNITSMKTISLWNPKDIWSEYVYSYKNGEFTCWQNETTNVDNGIMFESVFYTSGGVLFDGIEDHIVQVKGIPKEIQGKIDMAIDEGIANEGNSILIGYSLNRDLIGIMSGSGNDSKSPPASNGTPRLKQKVHGHPSHGHSNESENDDNIVPSYLRIPEQVPITLVPIIGSRQALQKCGSCPLGYEGPDKNCNCTKTECGHCPPGYNGPDENCNCIKTECKPCPPGYEGPDENCNCIKTECGPCPPGYEGPDANCECYKWVTVYR